MCSQSHITYDQMFLFLCLFSAHSGLYKHRKSFLCFAGNKSNRFLVLMSPVLPFDNDSVQNFYEVLDAVKGLVVSV